VNPQDHFVGERGYFMKLFTKRNDELIRAVEEGRIDEVSRWLEKGAKVDARDKFLQTPLHLVFWGSAWNKGIAELLIASGADMNVKDKEGQTPLHIACRSGCGFEVIDQLFAKGADVHARNNSGETPLHLAACQGYGAIVEKLIAEGANVNAEDDSGRTPLHRAADFGGLGGESDESICRLLILNHAKINALDKDGRTPLWHALKSGKGFRSRFVVFLVSKGAESGGSRAPHSHACKSCLREFPWAQGRPQDLNRMEQMICIKENLPFALMKKVTCPHCGTQSFVQEPKR
jgi:ankyrin repeat protein